MNKSNGTKRIIAILVMLVWAIQMGQVLVERTNLLNAGQIAAAAYDAEAKKQGQDSLPAARRAEIERELHTGWYISLSIATLCTLLGALAIAATRFWALLIALPCSAYLLIWYFSGPLATTSFSDAMHLKWLTAQQLDRFGQFLYRDIAIPVFFLCVLIMIAVGVLMSTGRRTGKGG